MTGPVVLAEVVDGVGHLTLNRPEAANTLDLQTARELDLAIQRVVSDGARVILLTGAGRRFCAGGDVTSFLATADPPAHLEELATTAGVAVRRLCELEVPVVAAVSGAVAGAGIALVCAADLVVADPSTKFAMAYADVGLTPDCGVSYLLPQVVGLRNALELTLTRRLLTAPEAVRLGLITEVHDEPGARAAELAGQIARGPAEALGQARRLLRAGFGAQRDAHEADEIATISASIGTSETQQRIAAFLAR